MTLNIDSSNIVNDGVPLHVAITDSYQIIIETFGIHDDIWRKNIASKFGQRYSRIYKIDSDVF